MKKIHFRSYIHKKMILFLQRIDKNIAEDDSVSLLDALLDNLMLDNVYKFYKPSGRKHIVIHNEICRGIGIEEFHHTYAISIYNAGKSGSSSVSNPSAGESSSDINCSYHELKAHVSYVCIYCEYFHPQCGRGKEKGLNPKPKLHHILPMTGEITGDQCQTCQKDEINHHSFGF